MQENIKTQKRGKKSTKTIAQKMILCMVLGAWLFAKPDNTISVISPEVYKYFVLEDFICKANKKYKIFIAAPTTKEPKEGYPVLYMLDANKQFPMLLNLYTPIKNPPLIIAIGYDTPLAYDVANRTYDYTPKAMGEKYSKGGGAQEFYEFLKDVLKPYVSSHYHINKTKEVFFGHSFGGLFGLYVMFNHGGFFSDYVIASPSLWWGDGVVIPKRKPLLNIQPHSIIITLGELENHPSNSPLNAKTLSAKLSKEGQNVKFIEFVGKTHGSSIEDALKTALEVFGE